MKPFDDGPPCLSVLLKSRSFIFVTTNFPKGNTIQSTSSQATMSLRTRATAAENQVGFGDENVTAPKDVAKRVTRSQAKGLVERRNPLQSIGNRNQPAHRQPVKAHKPTARTKDERSGVQTRRSMSRSMAKIPPAHSEHTETGHTDLTTNLSNLGILAGARQQTKSLTQADLDEGKHVIPNEIVLPLGIEDIDIGDADFPEFCPDYAKEIYGYLYDREGQFHVTVDYMDQLQTDITPKMRAVLIDWLIEVHLKFKLLQETLYLTVNTIDRFLEVHEIDRNRLQLVGVTCMLIASKFEEIYAPEVRDFIYITDNAYTREEILVMERLILNTLKFKFGVPMCLHFLRRMSKSAEADPRTHTLAKYFMEMTLTNYEMNRAYKQSQIAASALCLARKMVDLDDWNSDIEYYSTYDEDDITSCVMEIFEIIKNSPRAKFQACRKKYSSNRFFRVAHLAEAQVETTTHA
eukprot:CFRG8112T1